MPGAAAGHATQAAAEATAQAAAMHAAAAQQAGLRRRGDRDAQGRQGHHGDGVESRLLADHVVHL
jgi:hypothetical protein